MSAKPIDLKCQQVVELVNGYLGHALTAEDRIAFEKHLYTCPPCSTYLAQMKTVIEVAGALDSAPVPESVEQELLGLFRRWGDKGSR
ncbi:MAG TPA: anti-sigma factor [Polyangiaceae bacterium]|jgi:anti-sigma factor RsiW|nr:anti-sigma factor [Polyangiaceae bacterium]